MTMDDEVNGESWLAHYPEGVHWDTPLESRSLVGFMDDSVSRYSQKPCIDFLGRKYTYAQVGALIDKAAKGFQKIGVKKGTKVGLCLPNTPYSVICYFGILKAGGVVVNYNPLYAERELAFQIEDSHTEIMVTMDLGLIYPKVGAMFTRTNLKKIIVCTMAGILPPLKGLLFKLFKKGDIAKVPFDDQHIPFEALTDNDGHPAPVTIDPAEDVAVLQYTGGTTGQPKGAMLTHANLTINAAQLSAWTDPSGILQDGVERVIGVLPFFHVFAMTVVMNQGLAKGYELILLPRFELDLLLKTIQRTKATLVPAVPTIYTAINHAPNLKKYDLTSIKMCNSGGAPLPNEVRHDFERMTGCYLIEGYGLSESSPVASSSPPGGLNKEGSIGIPLPGTKLEIRNVEAPHDLLPQGEAGEICIIGPQVMKGYWDRPEETAETIIDGRLHTGDVGYMDEDGYIFIVDRLKDVILCGGYNVYPRNIEEAIYLHPAVEEVTVIGIPDEYRGQSPKAFIKLKDNETLTEDGLKAFLKDKISKIEMPGAIEFRAELPKTMIGKLSKKELVAEEAAKAATSQKEAS